jgi:hypothetical protein
MRRTALLACLLLTWNYAVSQSISTPSDCGAPEVVLQRYLAAVGGETAMSQMQTFAIEATSRNRFKKKTRRSRYTFKWKFVPKAAARIDNR